LLNRESTLLEWMEDPRGSRVFAPIFQQMVAQTQTAFGGGEAAGMDIMGFLMEMPLLEVLHFQKVTIPMPPEDFVDGLLAQISLNN
jgi:beta-glucosidase